MRRVYGKAFSGVVSAVWIPSPDVGESRPSEAMLENEDRGNEGEGDLVHSLDRKKSCSICGLAEGEAFGDGELEAGLIVAAD